MLWGEAQDHPRVGGEKIRGRGTANIWQGSPPHGQGKGSRHLRLLQRHRITPAWAGKSLHENAAAAVPGDHPRVGGEKSLSVLRIRLFLGSPPHGRGKVFFTFWIILHLGITPAWAGKSTPARARREKPQDHPRVGGKKLLHSGIICGLVGSPPRGRGKAFLNDRVNYHDGITPTWTGKR